MYKTKINRYVNKMCKLLKYRISARIPCGQVCLTAQIRIFTRGKWRLTAGLQHQSQSAAQEEGLPKLESESKIRVKHTRRGKPGSPWWARPEDRRKARLGRFPLGFLEGSADKRKQEIRGGGRVSRELCPQPSRATPGIQAHTLEGWRHCKWNHSKW